MTTKIEQLSDSDMKAMFSGLIKGTGLSQGEVAKHLGLARETVNRLASQNSSEVPSVCTVYAMRYVAAQLKESAK